MIRRFLLIVLLALPAVPRPAFAWWDDSWAFRKPITLDTTAAGANLGTSVAGAPILIRLSAGNFGYFADTAPDGADIRFIAGDDKTPLQFHIESYDPTTGMAFLWVTVPELAASSSQTIYMYYGNSTAKSAADPGKTYDVNEVLVYHFASMPPQDATSYGNQPVDVSAVANPASVIGAGVAFSGAESAKVPGSPILRFLPERGLTLSAWVNLTAEEADGVIAELTDPSGSYIRLGIAGLAPYVRVGSSGATTQTQPTASLLPGSWSLVTAVIAARRVTLYVDGREVSAVDASVPETGGDLMIGAASQGGNFLTGRLDEFTVANTSRSPDWIRAQFANQGVDDKLLRYGEDTQKDAGEKPSYLVITLRNVTVDGWVVIGVLTLMAIASWIIMIAKGLTVRRVRQDNRAFSADFRATAARNVAVLDRDDDGEMREEAEHPFLAALSGSHDHYQSSTLYHLYHAGISEVKKRVVGASVSAARVDILSSQALDAIRASIDATNVRETQKLNSQMVLLTLAIAGGPFLGLLGTVVGVMITFAAIAASGDVNVNSIAPGIAAALAATVAGLVVAIPALFGYNWLASQIKEIVADNRVFIDEFVTKLAEQYS